MFIDFNCSLKTQPYRESEMDQIGRKEQIIISKNI